MNILSRGTTRSNVTLLVLGVVCVFVLSINASAATVTQTYKAGKSLAKGTIVSLDKGASLVVEADRQNLSNLYGVVVEKGDLSFGQAADTNSAVVANGGVVDTLISTSNGTVDAGDPITVDAITGVGEKATKSGRIIGVAQDKIDKNANNTQTFTLSGDGSTVSVGFVPVKIEVRNYDITSGQVFAASGKSRNKLLQVADSLAGKQVKPYALIISGLLLLFGIFMATFMITSSGYASLIAIGRNPLAEKKIVRSLMRMLLASVIIFVLSLALAYAVITFL
jgi:hypothetical protein